MRILILCLFLIGCSSDPHEMWTFKNKIMGTYYVVKVEKGESKLKTKQIEQEIHGLLTDINMIFSTYESKSELSILNQLSAKTNMMLSSELIEVLNLSQEVHKKSAGAFDVTIGPLVNAWGFGPDGVRRQPRAEDITKLKSKIGMNKFQLSKDGTVQKVIKDLYIDLSAVAKGYAVDKVIEYLKGRGFSTALVEIGGEVRTMGKKEGQKAWKIGIEQPTETFGKGIHKVVPLVDMSMATSGSYRNFRKYGEQVFTHTINPTTGKPVTHKLISVTVIDKNCATADAYATALMVLGPEKGFELVEKEGMMAYFLVKTEKGIEARPSTRFGQYLQSIK
jgi:thiamine biosynthesis lipoprotein